MVLAYLPDPVDASGTCPFVPTPASGRFHTTKDAAAG
jgi:hypothetical protein